MMTARDLVVVLVSSLGTLLVANGFRSHANNLTTLGHPKAIGEKAFVLTVNLQFQDNASADALLKAWARAADWCVQNEPFLFAYEVAQSDQDPLRYIILERYRSKEDYTGPHRKSPAFKEFRPQMRLLQESGKVSVTGSSYQELGLGFT